MKKYVVLLSGILLISWITTFVSAEEWKLEGISIISRSERWADESIRFLSKSKTELSADRSAREQERLANLQKTNPTAYQAELKKIEAAQITAAKNAQISADRNAYMRKNYINDRTFDKSNDKMGDFYLLYQDQIKHNKTKLIVHHTAMTYDRNWSQQEVYQAIQRIYKYHTIDRDFGDLWYNFLIDHLGNIYEGRAGGVGAVGMHVAYNNIPSVGISLMGNYEEVEPTEAQIRALVNLLTALAKKYNINPEAKERYHQATTTYPYVSSKQNRTILGHRDIVATACPGKYLSQYLPLIRWEVKKRLQHGIVGDFPLSFKIENILPPAAEKSETSSEKQTTTSSSETSASSLSFGADLLNLKENNKNLFNRAVQKLKQNYFNNNIPQATNVSNKIEYKHSLEEIKNLISKDISVLLYELTTEYTTFEVSCEYLCRVEIDNGEVKGETYERPSLMVFFDPLGNITLTENSISSHFPADKVIITSLDELVEITNYGRKSYAGISRNTFRGKLIFKKDIIRKLEGNYVNQPAVINQLSFDDYMKGIVETNDQEHLEKNKVMALISKTYALFYLEKKNVHPSIPLEASYSAIDSPDSFQKYVGAGVEKTLKKRYQALEATKNQIVMYENILPILPYFNCAPRFTLSAKEKRGWQDTPYLQSTFELNGCTDFKGHGVGLAGQGAQYLAEKGATYEEILQYYYPGVKLREI